MFPFMPTRIHGLRWYLMFKNNYFLFSPMLHEVATGGLNEYHIVEPIRKVLKGNNFDFYKTEAKKIDFKKKIVYTDLGNIYYDYLVMAIGATTNFCNVKGARENCITLKDMQDAARIRDNIISCFEKASKEKNQSEIKKLLNFVVVGGGPTGVELAGEIAEFTYQIKQEIYHSLDKDYLKVTLIHRSPDLIPMAHEKCRKDAKKELEKKGVKILLNSSVTEVSKGSVEINNKEKISSSTIVWTSGVKPNKIETSPKIADEDNFFHVDEYLQIKKLKKAYALGDVALAFNPDSKQIPMLAQVATKQAKCAAYNIMADIKNMKKKKFVFKSSGFLVSVGQKFAVADVFGIRFKGFFAWWLWRTIYLFKLLGFANKFRVAYDWTLSLFFKRDTSEI